MSDPEDLPDSVFGCFSDEYARSLGAFCPCWLAAENLAKQEDRQCNTVDVCCACANTQYFVRTRLRTSFGLPQRPFSDCITLFFCSDCVNCQHARILKNNSNSSILYKNYRPVDQM
ncbi:hypothetical protein RCL1_008702 [Eukaryota sp. TZLM3-RCL]